MKRLVLLAAAAIPLGLVALAVVLVVRRIRARRQERVSQGWLDGRRGL